MDDTWKASLLSLFLLCANPAIAAVEDPEFVSQAQVDSLLLQFNSAKSTVDQTLLATHPQWTCNMYGVRSRLQIRRGLSNYNWSRQDDQWSNSGELPVGRYVQAKDGLQGTGERGVRDDVRQLGKDKLIARLSRQDSPDTILSYSVCTATP